MFEVKIWTCVCFFYECLDFQELGVILNFTLIECVCHSFVSTKPIKDAEYGVSRGIDFKLVSNVLNFDFPLTAKGYVHRVGRTARAGQMGTAISFVSSSEESQLTDVANLLLQKEVFNSQPNQTNKSSGN